MQQDTENGIKNESYSKKLEINAHGGSKSQYCFITGSSGVQGASNFEMRILSFILVLSDAISGRVNGRRCWKPWRMSATSLLSSCDEKAGGVRQI
jgi:hypothetical protein